MEGKGGSQVPIHAHVVELEMHLQVANKMLE